jgi:hypothetical protein
MMLKRVAGSNGYSGTNERAWNSLLRFSLSGRVTPRDAADAARREAIILSGRNL